MNHRDQSGNRNVLLNIPSIKVSGNAQKFPWFNELYKLYQFGIDHDLISDFIVHGSYGDFTNTNFSDLEISVCWIEPTESKGKANRKKYKFLKKLNNLIILIDPLQHHGVFNLSRPICQNYSYRDLPLSAYDDSWSISGMQLHFNLNWHEWEFMSLGRERLRATASSLLLNKSTFFKYGSNLYSQKRFLSNLFMLPVFIYNSHGFPHSKKNCIADVEGLLPEFIIRLIEVASEIRSCWPESPAWFSRTRGCLINQKIPGGMADRVAVNLFRNKQVSVSVAEIMTSKDFQQLSLYANQ